jgi:hypothetical protein
MMSVRPALLQWTRRTAAARTSALAVRASSSLSPYDQHKKELDEEKSATQRKVEAMTKVDPWMVYGVTEPDAPPVLPDNPSEISALDHAHKVDAVMPDGTARLVHIRQEQWKPGQNTLTTEKKWLISFLEEGTTATQNWNNPLMGWVSGSDIMASNIQIQFDFDSASEAVYFAKKRGWQFVVEEPILRNGRNDGAQYQDNFLPQTVVAKLKRDATQCKHWERQHSGTSHYDRPLKYHGDGEVPQHGPNATQALDKHVEGYYKLR